MLIIRVGEVVVVGGGTQNIIKLRASFQSNFVRENLWSESCGCCHSTPLHQHSSDMSHCCRTVCAVHEGSAERLWRPQTDPNVIAHPRHVGKILRDGRPSRRRHVTSGQEYLGRLASEPVDDGLMGKRHIPPGWRNVNKLLQLVEIFNPSFVSDCSSVWRELLWSPGCLFWSVDVPGQTAFFCSSRFSTIKTDNYRIKGCVTQWSHFIDPAIISAITGDEL